MSAKRKTLRKQFLVFFVMSEGERPLELHSCPQLNNLPDLNDVCSTFSHGDSEVQVHLDEPQAELHEHSLLSFAF